MIQLTAILIAIALLFIAASVQVKKRMPRVADWFRRNPMLGCALGILMASGLAWAADTKISALSATTDFVASKAFPAVNVANTSNEKWTAAQIGGLVRRTISAADTVVASDRAKFIEITSGTFTLSFTAAATLADGHWFYVYNSGTGVVTLDPNGAETLDGQTTITLNTGVTRRIFTNGTAFFSEASVGYELVQFDQFTTTGAGTWTKHPWCKFMIVDLTGGGGGGGGGQGAAAGAVRSQGSGGGGGARKITSVIPCSSFGATEAINVGASGTAGAAGGAGGVGGNSIFGTSGDPDALYAFGGGAGAAGAGANRSGGSGGGCQGAGNAGAATGQQGGLPALTAGTGGSHSMGCGGAASVTNAAGATAEFGGGSGGGGSGTGAAGFAGGVSGFGGGGGGSGGGVTTGNAAGAPGAGGDNDIGGPTGGGGAAGTSGAACTNGTAGATVTTLIHSGQGGGGGGSDTDSAGCTGGAGGVPGGGAGGGGGGTATGGAGGLGGRGEIRVWQFGALAPANDNRICLPMVA